MRPSVHPCMSPPPPPAAAAAANATSAIPLRRYGAHTADWAPHLGLYAYAAQNTVVMLSTQTHAVRTLLSGHSHRWVLRLAAAAAPCAAG